MNLYEEHYEILKKYKEAKRNYDKKLEKKALLILQTQPRAIDTSKENINGGTFVNKFEEFVKQLEKLDPELQKARNERDLQEYFLKKKELELKNSDNVLDKVYYYKYVAGIKKTWQIAIKINYGKSRTYDFVQEIKNKLNIK